MNKYKVGYIKSDKTTGDKYVTVEIEADKISVDSNDHLRFISKTAGSPAETIGYFSRNIWLKVMKKK